MRVLVALLAAVFLVGCQQESSGTHGPIAQPQGEQLSGSHYASRGAYAAEVFLLDHYALEAEADLRPITVSDHHSFAVVLPGELSGRRVFIRAGDFAQEVWLDVPPGGVVGVRP